MASIYDKASLVLIPSGSKTSKVYSQKPTNGDGDFTFSRSTAATRVNASGNIEKETQNLLLQSNSFDISANWTNSNTSETGGQSGYNGTNDAWKLTALSTGSGRRIQQGISYSGVNTFSIYAKAGNLNWVAVTSPSVGAYFDLANGVVGASIGTIIDSNIEDAGSGWYRCSFTANVSWTEIQIYIASANSSVSVSSGDYIYIQDAQLEQGLVARDYIETTTTAIYGGITDNVPRLDYQGSCPALLLEPQRTNIVPISEGVPEGTNNVTLTENYATSPEGAQNSLKVQKNGVDSNDRIQPIGNYNATLISGNDYTISCFVKNIDSTNAVTTLACRVSGGSLFRSGYDWEGSSLSYLATGYNAGTRKNIFVEDYGNGWWRIGFTFEANGTSGNFELDIDRRNGSNTTSIETWGWQLEAGSYATSYIPTYGSAVTRNADTTDDLDTSSLLTQSNNNTFFGEVVNHRNTGNTRFIASYDSARDNGDRILIYTGNGSSDYTLHCQYKVSGETSIQFNIKTNVNYGDTIKFAVVFNGTQMIGFANGVKTATATIVDGDNFNKFDITDVANEGGVYKQLILFPTALTDQEAIDLTTI